MTAHPAQRAGLDREAADPTRLSEAEIAALREQVRRGYEVLDRLLQSPPEAGSQ